MCGFSGCSHGAASFFFGGINCRNNDAMDVSEATWQQKEENRTNCVVLDFFSPLFFTPVRSPVYKNFRTYLLHPRLSIKCCSGRREKAGDGKVFSVLGLRFFPLLSPFLTFSSFANFSPSEKELFCSMLADHKSNFTGEIFMKSRLQAFSVVL